MVEYRGTKYYTEEEAKELCGSEWDVYGLGKFINKPNLPYVYTLFGWFQISQAEYNRLKRRGVF